MTKKIIFGINPVREALRKNSSEIDTLYILDKAVKDAKGELKNLIFEAKDRNIYPKKISGDELNKLVSNPKARHQNVVLTFSKPFEYYDIDDLVSKLKDKKDCLILIADSIQDVGNLGAMIRSANAAGVDAVIIPQDRSAEINPFVIKTSAGATEHTPIVRIANIAQTIEKLKKENIWVYGIEASEKNTIYNTDLKGRLAIVVGSEGKGIRKLVMEKLDLCLSIPMRGQVNSLNAAQAATVTLFEALRQRQG